MNDTTARTRAQRWRDAVLHRGPGYDLTPHSDIPRLTGVPLLEVMVAGERRNRARRSGRPEQELPPYPPCPVCRQPADTQDIAFGPADADEDDRVVTSGPCGHRAAYNLNVAKQLVARMRQILDREEQAARDVAELDRSRRYLRPVQATCISDDPDGVHLAVYSWLERAGAWVTGLGICGESMQQGPLPEGTEVTCAGCLLRREDYERYLAPGYQPGDDDPKALRERAEAAEREVAAARQFAAEMREYCSPHGVSVHYADRLIEVMDRAKEGR
ncbi:hypothetical protein [Streptomyces sp. NPDC001492]